MIIPQLVDLSSDEPPTTSPLSPTPHRSPIPPRAPNPSRSSDRPPIPLRSLHRSPTPRRSPAPLRSPILLPSPILHRSPTPPVPPPHTPIRWTTPVWGYGDGGQYCGQGCCWLYPSFTPGYQWLHHPYYLHHYNYGPVPHPTPNFPPNTNVCDCHRTHHHPPPRPTHQQ